MSHTTYFYTTRGATGGEYCYWLSLAASEATHCCRRGSLAFAAIRYYVAPTTDLRISAVARPGLCAWRIFWGPGSHFIAWQG